MQRRVLIVLSLWLSLVLTLPVSAQGGADGQTTIHVVQRGENLFRIALAYGTSVESIAQTNSLSNVTSIQVGQRLVIPSGIVNAEIATASHHIVQPGETLQHVALRHGSTKAIVAALNNIINPNQLLVGQVLDVSQSATGQQPLSRGYTYTVKTGDTLYQIAARYQASIGVLLRTNNLKSATLIYPGQQLLVPGGDDAPALQVLPAPLEELNINPLPVEVGRTFRVRVVSSQPISISGTFLDRTFQFAATDGSSTYIGLFGVHAFAIPGLYPLTLSIRDANGYETAFTSQIRVADGRYQSEEINVPADQLALLDPNLNSAETALLTRTMSNFTAQRYFDGPLGLPAAAPVSSPFGTRRSYNGGPYDRFHTGTDFAGPPGSPIYAPAEGIVVMVDTLSIYGNFTVIDHGWGVFSAYAHQTETYVVVGQTVSAGEVIGTIGNTGRSIGPHLHWELWVNGVETDAIQWTRYNFAE